MELPDPISGYLMGLVSAERRPAYLVVDADGTLRNAGGDLAAYGLSDLAAGRPAADQAVFLEGMLPVGDTPLFLPCVKMGAGVPADIHIFGSQGADCVVLLDAASYEIRHKLFQQHVNQLSLSSERLSRWADYQGAALSSVFAALDVAVLETADGRRFGFLSLVPAWFVEAWANDLSASGEFAPREGSELGRFLTEAARFWSSGESGQLASTLWEESTTSGAIVVRASALRVGDRKVLLVEHPHVAPRDRFESPLQGGTAAAGPPRAPATRTVPATTRTIEGQFEQRTAELLRLNQLLQWELTERIKAQQQNRLMLQTLNSVTEMIAIVDTEQKINYVNPSFMHGYGYTESEILGRDVRVLFSATGNEPGIAETVIRRSREVGWKGEVRSPRKDGTDFSVALSTSPIFDERFRVVGFVGVAQDLTERKHADAILRQKEEELQVSRRMEAIGRLAGGISHDFNNLLTVIIGYSEHLLTELPPDSAYREHVEGMRRAGMRATELTRKLSAFGRVQVMVPEVIDLNAVVRDLGDLVRRVVREDVEIEFSLDPDLYPINADRVQLEQVILNLVVNAREAMPFGGRLSVRSANVTLSGFEIPDGFDVEPGAFVMLEVGDTGGGMDEETQSRIFEPFYTTKPEGSGLGMATVYGIIQQTGGMISVSSAVGHGTRVEVYFPRTRRPVVDTSVSTAERVSTDGSETVLVVEDEDAIRRLVRTVLASHGYRVLDAPNVSEAIRVVTAHEGPIDLILTDIVMPGSSGNQLVEEVHMLRPTAKVLYMSGYADHAAVQERIIERGAAFLHKPFTVQALAEKVRSVLSGAAPSDA